MSASAKKKLRKEQNAAAITERQKKERKEARKLKGYTATFIIIMLLVVSIFVGTAFGTQIAGLFRQSRTAIVVGDHEINTVELNYFYVDSVQSLVNQYSSYGSYATTYLQLYTGLNASLPLDEQQYNKESGETWADFFTTSAKESAKWTYAMYDKAVAEGHTLTEDEQKSLDSEESTLDLYATYYGYSSTKSYLRASYGAGSTVKSYLEYRRVSAIANSYAVKYYNGLEFKDSDYREYEKDKMTDYNSYSFAYYYLSYQTFLKGGTVTKGEDGKETTTYSDEEKEAARKDAKAAAESLAIADNNNLEALNKAIQGLEIHKDKKEEELKKITATENKLVLSGSITNEDFNKWITDSARKTGDITTIEIKSGTGDDATVSGYYVLLYQGMSDNKQPLANVQHILVKFTGGTKDANGNVTYSDAEKKAAKDKADSILDEFLKGEKQDSAAFTKLAAQKSDDTGSKNSGGLIEDIYRDSNYVQSFKDWALDNRNPGDTGVIESEYGYHVMFYKEHDELTYRDYMIDIDLTNDRYEAWEKEMVENVTVTDKNLKGLYTDYVIAG